MTHEPEPGPDIEGLIERAITSLNPTGGEVRVSVPALHLALSQLAASALQSLKEEAKENDDARLSNLLKLRAAEARVTSLERQVKGLEGDAAQLAQRFHETFERLAPSFGYEPRRESAKPWAEVPEQNKRLLIAVCAALTQSDGPGSTGKGS